MSVRNFTNEAQGLIRSLTVREKYKMFEIVLAQLQKRQSDVKQQELRAVYDALVHDGDTDKTTLRSLEKGYQNSMSDDIRGGDLTGNARKNRKKA